jgi:hypothetical protein
MNVNELKKLFSNRKADIPIFYGDHTKFTAKFMFDRIKIAQTTYYWSAAATAGNLKLALRGKVIDWLNYMKDTEQIDISLWSRFEPQFKSHFNIQIQTADNIRTFQNLNMRRETIQPTLNLRSQS